ncbi:NHLP bacteriocin export ABC transporter permease/ATPase subunit [Reyranella sp.]|uniref:NHLP bacteriocin export ABC transporter permease/ATPase subunit n=1 Tax=Reyranella sp. TaxID=1929291 RepID=UPI003BA99FA1
MTAVESASGRAAAIDLAGLAAAARLATPARLFAVVLDDDGVAGARRFVMDLPAGAAVFPMGAPGAAFLLVDPARPAEPPSFTREGLDAAAIDAWYAALLAACGLSRGTGETVLLEAGESRKLAAGARLTARGVLWLQAARPVLRYPGDGEADGPPQSRLVVAEQVVAEIAEDAEIEAVTTATLLADTPPEALGRWSLDLAARLGAALVAGEAGEHERRRSARDLDEVRASTAMQRLRDIAAVRFTTVLPPPLPGTDLLAAALSVIADAQGYELRTPPDDDPESPLVQRLRRFATATPFQFREIALAGDWWAEEGPAFLAVDRKTARPVALVWRRGRWRATDPGKPGEAVVDKALADSLTGRGYMIYPALPERLGTRELLHFAVRGVRGDVVRLVVAATAATLASLLLPVATGAILGTAIPHGRFVLLGDMLLLLVTTTVGSAAFQVARAIALIRLGTIIDLRVHPATWDRAVRLRASFFREYSVGDLALRIMGIDAMRRILSGAAVSGAISGVFSLASLGIMLVYDASLAAFAAAYAVVAAGLIFLIGRQQMRLDRIIMQRKGAVSSLLLEMLRGIAKLRIAAAELRAFSRWAEAFAGQRVNAARSGRLGGLQIVLATSLPMLGAVGIFAIAAGGSHPIDVGSFAAFNAAFGQFTAALLAVAAAINSGIEVVPLYARIRPVFDAPLEVDSTRSDPGRLGGHVAVRNLSFRYAEDGPWILQDIDFEVRPGESLAIVGASGSGKSTIMRLLIGFEIPTRGGVFYDDHDLEKLDVRRIRRQVGTVLETSKLVPGSIYENIAGSAQLSREQVLEAIRLAGFEADLATMPMGLETFVAEGSGQLSGGQRQRVMIARALVHKPRLIFFDEATSALDNRTQAIVGASLAATNATRIVIAHRLSTIRGADRILVLDRGRIVEAGTYDELIAREGVFFRLARRQLL